METNFVLQKFEMETVETEKKLCFQYCFHYKASNGKALKVIGNNGNKILYISNIYIIRHIRI